MVPVEGDHVNWVLAVILVALALLLAWVSSTSYGVVAPGVPRVGGQAIPVRGPVLLVTQERKEARTPSEIWYVARELYREGRISEASKMFERVVSAIPDDPAARMWAGIAAFRAGSHALAARHWMAAWDAEGCTPELGVWPAVALAAVHLESNRVAEAARFIVPLERGDRGPDAAEHPVVLFYAALIYERMALAAPKYLDAIEESLGEKFSPMLGSSRVDELVSPNSQSWLIFLTKRALQRTIRRVQSFDWTAPVVPWPATVEPSFAPTVEELLEALGSTDFASQARQKLRALKLYESPSERKIEFFDDPRLLQRARFIA